jgi:hypothetical protein
MKKVYVPNPKKNTERINPWNKFYKQILEKKERNVDNKRRYTP